MVWRIAWAYCLYMMNLFGPIMWVLWLIEARIQNVTPVAIVVLVAIRQIAAMRQPRSILWLSGMKIQFAQLRNLSDAVIGEHPHLESMVLVQFAVYFWARKQENIKKLKRWFPAKCHKGLWMSWSHCLIQFWFTFTEVKLSNLSKCK